MTWPTMGAALVGVALMLGDEIAYGRTAGNIVALVSSVTFAIMLDWRAAANVSSAAPSSAGWAAFSSARSRAFPSATGLPAPATTWR